VGFCGHLPPERALLHSQGETLVRSTGAAAEFCWIVFWAGLLPMALLKHLAAGATTTDKAGGCCSLRVRTSRIADLGLFRAMIDRSGSVVLADYETFLEAESACWVIRESYKTAAMECDELCTSRKFCRACATACVVMHLEELRGTMHISGARHNSWPREAIVH